MSVGSKSTSRENTVENLLPAGSSPLPLSSQKPSICCRSSSLKPQNERVRSVNGGRRFCICGSRQSKRYKDRESLNKLFVATLIECQDGHANVLHPLNTHRSTPAYKQKEQPAWLMQWGTLRDSPGTNNCKCMYISKQNPRQRWTLYFEVASRSLEGIYFQHVPSPHLMHGHSYSHWTQKHMVQRIDYISDLKVHAKKCTKAHGKEMQSDW